MTGARKGRHYWARVAWRRGGRWERILAALYRRDMAAPAIRHATQTGEHSAKAERRKVGRALDDMVRVGLIQPCGDLYEITALGSQTLREGRIPPVDDGRRDHAVDRWTEQAAGA